MELICGITLQVITPNGDPALKVVYYDFFRLD